MQGFAVVTRSARRRAEQDLPRQVPPAKSWERRLISLLHLFQHCPQLIVRLCHLTLPLLPVRHSPLQTWEER